MKSLVPKPDKRLFYEFPPKTVLYLIGNEKYIFYFMQNAITAMLFSHVFSPFFQIVINAGLPSLQNAMNPLSQSQRTIPRTVNSTGNGGALNTPGILDFLIYFVLCDQQTNKIRAAR